eukprot:scaffold77265_cov18-Prasinocladus_malaysianus.AAC.1
MVTVLIDVERLPDGCHRLPTLPPLPANLAALEDAQRACQDSMLIKYSQDGSTATLSPDEDSGPKTNFDATVSPAASASHTCSGGGSHLVRHYHLCSESYSPIIKCKDINSSPRHHCARPQHYGVATRTLALQTKSHNNPLLIRLALVPMAGRLVRSLSSCVLWRRIS